MKASVVRRMCAVIGVSVGLYGCSSTLKPAELNDEGRFETGSVVTSADQTINAPYSAERYGKMIVVFTFTENKTVNEFFFQSIKNSKKFEQVYDEDELEKFVIKNQIPDVTDASSLLSMNKLAKSVGPFLVVKPYVEWKGGYDYIASVEVIDAQTTETVFTAQKKAFNWAGLDKPLLYPLMNAFIDWTEGKEPPPPPPPRKKK